MHRPVTNDPGLGLQEVLIQIDYLSEMNRAGLFFTFEKKLEIERRREILRPQRVEGRENSHHAGFIVRRTARVKPPF